MYIRGDEKIPVLILNWNGWEDTIECLHSLQQAGAEAIWVVDNGSTCDRSGEIARLFSNLRFIQLDQNHGWAGGYNRAVALAAAEGYRAVYLLNNDTTVHPGFLTAALEVARDVRGEWASVGSRILFSDGTVKFDGRYHQAGKEAAGCGPRGPSEVESANGSGMLINLAAWRATGPFDEAFFCYGEEHEWCLRATSHGFRNYVAPDSVVWHKTEGSDTNANAAYYRARNLYLLANGYRGVARLKRRVGITYSLWRRTNEARRLGDARQKTAVLQALYDGLGSRFGKRREWECPLWLHAVAYTWPFPAGFFRRARGRASTHSTREQGRSHSPRRSHSQNQ